MEKYDLSEGKKKNKKIKNKIKRLNEIQNLPTIVLQGLCSLFEIQL